MNDKPKLKIVVLHPGALPGKTNGDVVECPSEDEIAKAKASPGLLRLVEVKAREDQGKPATKGGAD